MTSHQIRIARITVDARTQLLFNWEGLYTWSVTGPAAAPVSRHTPLPSTLAGMLASLVWEPGIVSSGSPDEVYKLVSKLLGERVVLKGPLLAQGDRLYLEVRGLLLDLECIVDPNACCGRVMGYELPLWVHAGTSLRMDSHTVVQHMLYTAAYTMHKALYAGDFTLYAEAYYADVCRNSGDKEVLKALVEIGGDRGVAKTSIACTNSPTPLRCREGFKLLCLHARLRDEIAEQVAGKSKFTLYALVLTPAPLDSDILNELLEKGSSGRIVFSLSKIGQGVQAKLEIPTREEIRNLYENTKLEILGVDGRRKELDRDMLSKMLQPRAVSRPIGYDRTRNKPRPYHPMLEPGSLIKLNVEANQPLSKNQAKILLDEIFTTGLSTVNLSPHMQQKLSALGWGLILVIR